SRDLNAARKMLEQSNSTSWRGIWETRANKQIPAPIMSDKGRKQHGGRLRLDREKSGSEKRKYIPSVMRDDPPPPAPKPMRQLSEMFLTPEQVDPDFKGTSLEFTAKYGHVLLHTKAQREETKRQEGLQAWLGTM